MLNAKMLWFWETDVGWDGEAAYKNRYKRSIPGIDLYWKGHDNKAWWINPTKL